MVKNIIFIHNMGASGGSWLSDVLNLHPRVRVWFAINQMMPNLRKKPRGEVMDFVNKFLARRVEQERENTLGFIKAFFIENVEYCRKTWPNMNIITAQTIRHPIVVLLAKAGHKVDPHTLVSPQKMFENHLKFYAQHYDDYMIKAGKAPIYKVEDMNQSLMSDKVKFKKDIEQISGVKWSGQLIEEVLTLWKECPVCKGTGLNRKTQFCSVCKGLRVVTEGGKPAWCKKCKKFGRYEGSVPRDPSYWGEKANCGRCSGKAPEPCHSVSDAWNFWHPWMQNMFKQYFDGIMEKLGYDYP